MSTRWRAMCETDGWVYTWSDTEPTDCPNNAAHTIVADSTTTYSALKPSSMVAWSQTPKTNFDTKTRMMSFIFYAPLDTIGGTDPRVALSVSSYVISGATYGIVAYNITQDEPAFSATFSNTSAAVNDMGDIVNRPANGDLIEIQAYRIGGTSANYVYVTGCQILVEME